MVHYCVISLEHDTPSRYNNNEVRLARQRIDETGQYDAAVTMCGPHTLFFPLPAHPHTAHHCHTTFDLRGRALLRIVRFGRTRVASQKDSIGIR